MTISSSNSGTLRHRTRPKAKYIRLANWVASQLNYRDDRQMPWAKLHTSYLDVPEFELLPDQSKYHVLGLILLVQRMGFNRLLNDPTALGRKISANTPIDIDLLLRNGFLEVVKLRRRNGLSGAERGGTDMRRETEKESKSDTRSAYSYEVILRYGKAMKAAGKGIKRPADFARQRASDGKADKEIAAWLNTQPSEGEQPGGRRFPDPKCPKCRGSGETVANGQWAVRCDCSM